MQTLLGSFDKNNYKKILKSIKDEQRIIRLEEQIDNERIKRNRLEQESRLLLLKIEAIKKKGNQADKYRSSSMARSYKDEDGWKKNHKRNIITSLSFLD